MLFVVGAIVVFTAMSSFSGMSYLPSVSRDNIQYLNFQPKQTYQPEESHDVVDERIQGASTSIINRSGPTLAPPLPCDPKTAEYKTLDAPSLQMGTFSCPTLPPQMPTVVVPTDTPTPYQYIPQ